jgi:dihydrodipicolinate synthase/N-acetylneuraminate lyase
VRTELQGLWGFALSPFTRAELNCEALEVAAAFQVEGGVDALCCCGAIAQAETLDRVEREAALDAVLRGARGRAPVVLALPADDEGPATAARAAELGAHGLLAIPVSDCADELRRTLDAIHSRAPDLALVLYHRPPLLLAPDDLVRLCEHPALVAVKDGHRDARLYRRLRAVVPGRLTWIVAYEDLMLPFGAIGAEAFSPVSASYAPEYARACLALLAAGELAALRTLLEAHAYPMMDLRLSRPHIDVAVVKAAQRACGLPAGAERLPQLPLTAAEEELVQSLVSDLQRALGELAGAAA